MEAKWSEPLETDGNLSLPLERLVTERLPWLFQELGFRVTSSTFDPRSFGDSIVILESDNLRLRFERDRGQVIVYLAAGSEPQKWFSLVSLYEAVHNGSVEPRYTLEANASLLRTEFPALVEALGPKLPETQKEIDRRKNQRLRALGL